MAHPLAIFTVLPYLLSFFDKRKFSYLIFSLANSDFLCILAAQNVKHEGIWQK